MLVLAQLIALHVTGLEFFFINRSACIFDILDRSSILDQQVSSPTYVQEHSTELRSPAAELRGRRPPTLYSVLLARISGKVLQTKLQRFP